MKIHNDQTTEPNTCINIFRIKQNTGQFSHFLLWDLKYYINVLLLNICIQITVKCAVQSFVLLGALKC